MKRAIVGKVCSVECRSGNQVSVIVGLYVGANYCTHSVTMDAADARDIGIGTTLRIGWERAGDAHNTGDIRDTGDRLHELMIQRDSLRRAFITLACVAVAQAAWILITVLR